MAGRSAGVAIRDTVRRRRLSMGSSPTVASEGLRGRRKDGGSRRRSPELSGYKRGRLRPYFRFRFAACRALARLSLRVRRWPALERCGLDRARPRVRTGRRRWTDDAEWKETRLELGRAHRVGMRDGPPWRRALVLADNDYGAKSSAECGPERAGSSRSAVIRRVPERVRASRRARLDVRPRGGAAYEHARVEPSRRSVFTLLGGGGSQGWRRVGAHPPRRHHAATPRARLRFAQASSAAGRARRRPQALGGGAVVRLSAGRCAA